MNRLTPALLLILVLVGLTPPARAQILPTPFRPDLPAPAPPPLVPAAPDSLTPSQTALRCTEALSDGSVDITNPAQSPWLEYRRVRTLTTGESSSPPGAILMLEDNDGDPGTGLDSDSTGQEIAVPSSLSELYGSLRFRYASGSTGPGDRLRIELYEVGRITSAGLLAQIDLDVAARDDGTWQTYEWELIDQATITRLRGLGRVALLFTTVNADNGAPQQLWLDDLSASVCVPAASLSGQVLQAGQAAADAEMVVLTRTEGGAGGATSLVAVTQAAADGSYRFSAVPALTGGASYRVWYLNAPTAATRSGNRLGFWAGPLVTILSDGAQATSLNLEVGDVELIEPAPGATVVASDAQPARFRWFGRGLGSERFQFCLYDPERGDLTTGLPRQLCGPIISPSGGALTFELGPSSFASAPDFGFAYGRTYRWYVVVYDRDPRFDDRYQYGYSFAERSVTFVATAPLVGGEPPTAESGDPAPGAAGADWTLLIYAAADNALGDPARAPRLARPAAQLARLPALAAAAPNVNLLSLTDDYGNNGALLCAYPAGAPADCRRRSEPDSADPQTLAAFIADGLARYPARQTALLILSPGQAAGELALDETGAGHPRLTLAGLRAAYAAAGLGAGTRLDLVIYQAPLLGSLELLRSTAPYARYMVAASDQIWQLAPYERLVPLLAGPARTDAAAAARGAVTAYRDTADTYGAGLAVSLAAYDLGRADAITQAADELAVALRGALASDSATMRPVLDAVRAAVRVYDSSGNGRHDELAAGGGTVALEEDALVDLRDLAARLSRAVGTPAEVVGAAEGLIALLDAPASTPVIASVQRSGRSISGAFIHLNGASGLGLFFPNGNRLGGQPALVDAALYGASDGPPRDGSWGDLLRGYLGSTLGLGPGGVTEGLDGAGAFEPLPGGLIATDLVLPLVRR